MRGFKITIFEMITVSLDVRIMSDFITSLEYIAMKQNYPHQYINDCTSHHKYQNNNLRSDDILIMYLLCSKSHHSFSKR